MSRTPFQKISEAARTTGLSQYFIRNGCKDGTIPCIRSGTAYLVDVDGLVLQLQQQARAGARLPLQERDERGAGV